MSRLRQYREKRAWSQAELARRAGISRSGVAAIENGTLVPSVKAAMALARILECSVEELFGAQEETGARWAWPSSQAAPAYWEAAFDQNVLAFPVEPLPYTLLPPDGRVEGASQARLAPDLSKNTLVMASCDPAVGVLAAAMESAGVRLLAFQRSSEEALSLLKRGLVHVAGMHLCDANDPDGNAVIVREKLGSGYRLVRGAVWHDGVAVRPGGGLRDFKKLQSPRVRWIGRKPGSGARRCQDKVFEGGSSALKLAENHWDVTTAIRLGWADAGVCHSLTAEQAGLEFLMVSQEAFDLCYPAHLEEDPRLMALRRVLRGTGYRKSLSCFRGMDTRTTGTEARV